MSSFLRFRESIRLGPGVRLNLNRRSAGVSLGGRRGRVSFSTRGRRTASIGLPGGVRVSRRIGP
jgi:hypothetical protein